jgi:hypothetical protein
MVWVASLANVLQVILANDVKIVTFVAVNRAETVLYASAQALEDILANAQQDSKESIVNNVGYLIVSMMQTMFLFVSRYMWCEKSMYMWHMSK